ncbi:DUF362 domain-containing protein [Desulfallas sp. Bu1-1]|jgi:uncharacterized protein (DUF362 family)|uniref:DUF362 domain-containing protein n=1 Tax=Desulfallas sp. Bu1-1 TaxID=2787620 RepID=UPI00189D34FE|nr:DUF362 domain-containing protein [Desulfallas sp. Bu1-1]MBF7082715.1 DUF362 domain-containing protein [Desulfallas sp. Bu1-1]
MTKPVVSVVKFDDAYQSLRRALDLCQGLGDLNPGDKILIKPNLVSWDFDLPFPPYGVVTTSAVMWALVRVLAEEGFTGITIGEGPLMVPKTIGQAMYKELGYDKLKEKYGVKLVDFNEEKFVKVDCNGLELSLAEKVLEADKIINVPVLKTHNQAKVSLGIKNLKGCINRASKMFCHGKDIDLNYTFPHIAEKLPVALTIIDGVFSLAKGPGPTGKAERFNMLVASRDILAADVVGAALLGYKASEVEHLAYFAKRNGGSVDINDIDVRGEDVEKNAMFLDYDWEWTGDNTGPVGYAKRGITGLAVRKYDNTMCTGCSMLFNPVLIMLMSAYKGEPFPNIEVISGKVQTASPGFDHTVLFGMCPYKLNKDNPNIKNAIAIKGCPPDLREFEKAMQEVGVACDYNEYVKYRHYIFNRYKAEEGFDLGLFKIREA